MKEGDWECPKPSTLNFARRKECHICKTPSPFGTTGVSAPPGLFKTTDWACAMCGNVNWERRTTCNICQTAKPNLANTEKRDGAGGGFNERQNRVTSSRAEVDADGYDDFGQIRKKISLSKKEREQAALQRLNGTYGSIMQPAASSIIKKFKYCPEDKGKISNPKVQFPKAISERRDRSPTPQLRNRHHRSPRKYRSNERRSRSRSPTQRVSKRSRSRSPYRYRHRR